MCACVCVEKCGVFVSRLLDAHWTLTGRSLDTHWTLTGHSLDTHWTSWCSALVRIAILLIDACGVGRHSASLLICVWGSNCLTQIGKIAMCQITLHRPICKIAMRTPQQKIEASQPPSWCPEGPPDSHRHIFGAPNSIFDTILRPF